MALLSLAARGDIVAQLDSLFCERYPRADEPGAAVLIAIGDSIVYERYFGIADMESGEVVGDNTLFNIASCSKQFTVCALMQVLGTDLQRPAADYFAYPQPFWRDVTLEHLASHTSGIPDARDRSDRDAIVFADEELSASYFPSVDSLQFAPGTAYDYLNPSFILLARVVEKETGEDFYDYVRRNIFDRAAMPRACFFDCNGMPPHTAHGYEPDGDGWREYDFGEETFFATRPDGGIYATARDILQWESALADGRILPADVLADAYRPRVSVTDSPYCDYQRYPNTSYALGWFVDTTPGRPVKVYHTGDNGGFQAYIAKYPSTGLRIVILENRHDNPRRPLIEALDNLLLPL